MKTRDGTIRDLAGHAEDQCEDLFTKMHSVISGFDDDDEPENERLCGITRDRDGRSMLAFAEPGTTGRRTVVYVDAILALAKLLNSEVEVEGE